MLDDTLLDLEDLPILDDEVDRYLDAEIDQLCCDENGINKMLDDGIEQLIEANVLNDDLRLMNNGIAVPYLESEALTECGECEECDDDEDCIIDEDDDDEDEEENVPSDGDYTAYWEDDDDYDEEDDD